MLVCTVALAAVSWGGFFYQDDFLFLSMAHDAPLTFGYLAEGAFGHFFPGFRLAFTVLDRTVGLDHHAAVVAVALLHLASMVAMARLLALLFGRSAASLALLVVFGLSGLWLSGYLWWVSALQVMPAMLLTVVAIDAHVRFVLWRRMRHVLVCALAFGVSLLFYEKPVQLLVMLPLITLLLFTPGVSPRAWGASVLRVWPMWAGFAAVLALYAIAYLTGDFFVATPRPSAGTVAHMVALAWHQAFIPSFFGGAAAFDWNGSLGGADPPRWLALAEQLVLVGLVVLTCRRRPVAWRGWALLLIAFVLNVLVIAWTRAGLFGAGVGRDLKYLIDILPFAVLGLGTALVGLRVGPLASERERLGPWPGTAAAIGLTAFVALFAISAVAVGTHWHDGANAAYARAFSADLRAQGPDRPDTVVFDTDTPMLSPAFQPYQRASVLLRLFDERIRFAGTAERTLTIAPDGHLRPGALTPAGRLELDKLRIDGRRRGGPSRGPRCLPAAPVPRTIAIPLSAPLPPGHPYLRLVATARGPAGVTVGQQAGIGVGAVQPARRAVTFGLGRTPVPLYVPLEAPGATELTLILSPGSSICLRDGIVGSPPA